MFKELVSYYRKRLPDPTEAEDFAQSSFERLLSRIGVENTAGLLWVIASGLLKNEYRDHDQRESDFEERQWPGVRERQAALAQRLRNGDEEFIGSKLWHSPMSHLESLPAPDPFFATNHDLAVRDLDANSRDAYILGVLRGLPSRESAPLLGVSHTTVAARRELATATIREEIAA